MTHQDLPRYVAMSVCFRLCMALLSVAGVAGMTASKGPVQQPGMGVPYRDKTSSPSSRDSSRGNVGAIRAEASRSTGEPGSGGPNRQSVQPTSSGDAVMQEFSAENARTGLLDAMHLQARLTAFGNSGGADASMDQALNTAVKVKKDKGLGRVTLEERMALEEKVDKKAEALGGEVKELFQELLTRHEDCHRCQRDCTARRFHEYQTHSLQECRDYCKLMICGEVLNPESPMSYREQVVEYVNNKFARSENPTYAKPSLFTNYLDEYLREYGQEGVLSDSGEEKFELVWALPDPKPPEDEVVRPDVFEQLRTMEPLPGRKAEQVLVDSAEEKGLVSALVLAQDGDARRLSWTRAEVERDRRAKEVMPG